jgi:glycosyltransferase involved in cell wall biosynthesis
MAQAGCFIIASRYDHWSLVIHEATCAGLPILATNTCGASIELVQDGFNGYRFPPEDVERLVQLMSYISDRKIAQEMGKNSLQISYRYTPQIWAKRILVDIPLAVRNKDFLQS